MADTVKRLIGPISLTGSAATVYTVPSLTTTIVRDIDVCNETSSAATITLSIGTDGSGKRILKAVSVPANSIYQYTGNIVLSASEIVQAYSGTASSLTLTASGVESV